MISSSGCWERFGEIVAREFSQPGWGSDALAPHHAAIRGWANEALTAIGRA